MTTRSTAAIVARQSRSHRGELALPGFIAAQRPGGATQEQITGAIATADPDVMLPPPSRPDRDACALARYVIRDIALAHSRPDRHAIPALVQAAALEHVKHFVKKPVRKAKRSGAELQAERRTQSASQQTLVMHAWAFSQAYLWEWQPLHGWHWAGQLIADTLAELPDELSDDQDTVGQRSPRLAWRHDDGSVILDELHPAHRPAGLNDTWSADRIDAGMQLGERIPGFLGVRLLPVRLERLAVLYSPTGELMRLDEHPRRNEFGLWR